MIKKVILGEKCKTKKGAICHKYKDCTFRFDDDSWNNEKIQAKIKKYIPPYHNDCDCKIIVVEPNSKIQMENSNKKRLSGEEITVGDKIVTCGVIIKTEFNRVYQVKLTLEHEKMVMNYIKELHGGKTVMCHAGDLTSISLDTVSDDIVVEPPIIDVDPKDVN